jgi:glycerol-3-phosphate acyltransferase PlsX
MKTVAVDAMGGDHAPGSVVEGAAEASLQAGVEIALVGDEQEITRLLSALNHDPSRIRVIAADGRIPMDASPRKALDEQPEASLPTAARIVAKGSAAGGADALVSAGNTGAVILACSDAFKRIPGVQRTGLAAVVPTERRHGEKSDPFTLLLDVGATVRVRAEDLVSFALMGASYAAIISKHTRPKVALLSKRSWPLTRS